MSTVTEELVEDNEAVILAMMEAAEKAPEPGTLKPMDVLHKGDEELPAPMIASALKSAGYRWIYDPRTGERSLSNANMLPAQLRKVDDEGNRMFVTIPPTKGGKKITPRRGKYRCMLHPDERKPEWDEMGMPTCPKTNLTSSLQVRLHMQHRHKTEWATIEDLRLVEEREADRAFQRAVLQAAGGEAPKGRRREKQE